jgi:hypothetical protein
MHADHKMRRFAQAGRHIPVLRCHACGEYPPFKSNQGIAEERERLGAYLSVPPESSCPNADCANHSGEGKGDTAHLVSHLKTCLELL